jgi:hypothetical protein
LLKAPSRKEGCPQVQGRAHGLFDPVVKVVAERWTHLRLGFDCGNELAVFDHKQIPLLRRAVESRQLQCPPVEDAARLYSRISDDPGEELDKAVHLGAAGDGASKALISAPARFLLVLLAPTRDPVVGNGISHSALDVFGGGQRVYRHELTTPWARTGLL